MNDAFETAHAAARARMQRRETIGRLQEKELHATLKFFLDPDQTHHEVRLPEGPVADIFDGERVTEIQTGDFSALRPKLARLLERYPVTVVCPIVRHKTVSWVHPDTGERTPPRRSPKTGEFWDAAPQLVYILPLLTHPRLILRLMLVDVEEYRLLDGWGNGGRRGAHRLERIPKALGPAVDIRAAADLRILVPADLTQPFTAAQYGRRAGLRGRRLSAAIKVLRETGVIARTESDGKPYRYTVA